MNFQNIARITGPYGAVIDGKRTGLAGCGDSAACNRAAYCLRAEQTLQLRAKHLHDGKCGSFIAKATGAAA